MTEEKDSPTYDLFKEWAIEEGVNLEDEEDWMTWWRCWYDGFRNGCQRTLNTKPS